MFSECNQMGAVFAEWPERSHVHYDELAYLAQGTARAEGRCDIEPGGLPVHPLVTGGPLKTS